jgi:hypothetical protein
MSDVKINNPCTYKHKCCLCEKMFICVDNKEYPPCTCIQVYEHSEKDDCDCTYYFCSEKCKKKHDECTKIAL